MRSYPSSNVLSQIRIKLDRWKFIIIIMIILIVYFSDLTLLCIFPQMYGKSSVCSPDTFLVPEIKSLDIIPNSFKTSEYNIDTHRRLLLFTAKCLNPDTQKEIGTSLSFLFAERKWYGWVTKDWKKNIIDSNGENTLGFSYDIRGNTPNDTIPRLYNSFIFGGIYDTNIHSIKAKLENKSIIEAEIKNNTYMLYSSDFVQICSLTTYNDKSEILKTLDLKDVFPRCNKVQ